MSEIFHFNLKLKNTRPNDDTLQDDLCDLDLGDAIIATNPYVISVHTGHAGDNFKAAVESVVTELESVLGEIEVIEVECLNTPPDNDQTSGDVTVTKNELGQIVAVTRTDEEGKVLSVIAESDNLPNVRDVSEAIQMLEMALSFSLCNYDLESTRLDIKKAQGELSRLQRILNIDVWKKRNSDV